jgi:HSP20 family protein
MSLLRKNEDHPVWPNFFNDFFNRNWNDWTNRNFSETNTTLPSVNIKERENDYEVEMAAPGLGKEDFKIELDHEILTISSEKKTENETKKGQLFTRKEFSYQSFTRSFTLPDTADNDRISAIYDNGILKVLIPKREESKARAARTIDIN